MSETRSFEKIDLLKISLVLSQSEERYDDREMKRDILRLSTKAREMADEIDNQSSLPDDHNCRNRVVTGNAERVAVYENSNTNIQLKYECDLCGNEVYRICSTYNMQVVSEDGSTFEPEPDVPSDQLHEAELGCIHDGNSE